MPLTTLVAGGRDATPEIIHDFQQRMFQDLLEGRASTTGTDERSWTEMFSHLKRLPPLDHYNAVFHTIIRLNMLYVGTFALMEPTASNIPIFIKGWNAARPWLRFFIDIIVPDVEVSASMVDELHQPLSFTASVLSLATRFYDLAISVPHRRVIKQLLTSPAFKKISYKVWLEAMRHGDPHALRVTYNAFSWTTHHGGGRLQLKAEMEDVLRHVPDAISLLLSVPDMVIGTGARFELRHLFWTVCTLDQITDPWDHDICLSILHQGSIPVVARVLRRLTSPKFPSHPGDSSLPDFDDNEMKNYFGAIHACATYLLRTFSYLRDLSLERKRVTFADNPRPWVAQLLHSRWIPYLHCEGMQYPHMRMWKMSKIPDASRGTSHAGHIYVSFLGNYARHLVLLYVAEDPGVCSCLSARLRKAETRYGTASTPRPIRTRLDTMRG